MTAMRPRPASLRSRGTDISHAAEAPLGKEPLQVRIPVAVKRRFKSHAALRGLEPHALFVKIWEHYEASLAPEPGQAQATQTRVAQTGTTALPRATSGR